MACTTDNRQFLNFQISDCIRQKSRHFEVWGPKILRASKAAVWEVIRRVIRQRQTLQRSLTTEPDHLERVVSPTLHPVCEVTGIRWNSWISFCLLISRTTDQSLIIISLPVDSTFYSPNQQYAYCWSPRRPLRRRGNEKVFQIDSESGNFQEIAMA